MGRGEIHAQLASGGGAGADKRVGTRLSVASFKRKRAKTYEKSFEKTFAAALSECGRRSWHMSCREKGWPDRYCVGGVWIELKSLEVLGKVHGLSTRQITKLNELQRGGDRCFYMAKIGDSFVLIAWTEFKQHMRPDQCPRYHYRSKVDLKEAIKYVIGYGSAEEC